MLLVIFWIVQVREMQKQAEENTALVYQVLGELKEGVSYEEVAANLLKGNVNSKAAQEGMKSLAEYGYDADYVTLYRERTRVYAVEQGKRYLFLYFLFYGMFLGICRIIRWDREKKFIELQEVLEKFYNGEYEFLAGTYEENTENLLYTRMESLGQKIMLNEKRLEKEKEETKALITDLSHQLKTPVASIKMCFQMLEGENLTKEETEEFLKRLGHQISHLEGLLAALVNISRMEMGVIEIQKEWGNIFETVVQAVNQVYMKAEEKGIQIVVQDVASDVEQLKLPHDKKWTKEAIVNVLENAIKYSPVESCIYIRITKQLHFLRLEIEDEGIGIRKEEINRIFQRFYRGNDELIKMEEGSGVGLYLTRKILEEQGGNITVVFPYGNKKKKGTTFAIMLRMP